MKKLLVGCLVGVVLMGVAGVVAAVYLWRAAAPMVRGATDLAARVERLNALQEIERGLEVTTPFNPPASGELTIAQVERFVQVQAAVKAALGSQFDALAAKYREMVPSGTTDPPVPSPAQVLGALSEIPTIYLDASRAQVQAMNAAKFSRAEFRWVRFRVYQAAGLDAARYDAADLERAIKSVAAQAQVPVAEVTLPDAPAANRALVRPYAARISEWLPLAFFGL
jgi:hypothetical protein